MAYNVTPQAAQRINDTQPLIQQNFVNIQADFSINHSPINNADPTIDGKHIKVDFITDATHPAVTGTDIMLYNFLNPTTTLQEIYLKKVGVLGTAGIPITATSGGVTPGWTYLPSGLLVKWGEVVSAVASDVDLNATGPNFSAVTLPIVAFATPQQTTFGPAVAFIVGPAATPVLQIRTTTVGCPTYWIVIGV